MKVSKNCAVSIHFTLKSDSGDTIDSSIGGEPLVYLHGHQNIVPGLEAGLEGCQEGEKRQVVVAPAEGYGEKDERMTQRVPREMFGGVETIELGMRFQAQTPEGQTQVVEVIELTDSEVIVDGNHALAGETLHFDVEIIEVRLASEHEIQEGQVLLGSCQTGCCG